MRCGGLQEATQLRVRGEEGLLLRRTQGGGYGGRRVTALREAELSTTTAVRLRGEGEGLNGCVGHTVGI